MMEMAAAVVIILHGPDKHEIRVNPQQITALHSPKPNASKDDKLYAEGLHCLVNLSDGKSISVIETCPHVVQLIYEATK